ncbi:MAG TPA: exosortase family protein XrtF [Ohtaekwangia sp.]|nr:exosortase family protein XrtF [Ohtaekwangia sp.]
MRFSLSEFKPTLFFLSKFIGLYLVASLLYGFYITSYSPRPDPMTSWISETTAAALTFFGWPVTTHNHLHDATCSLWFEGRGILAVYEGCNGLNTIIIFAAFMVAFGPLNRSLLWFLPLGILIIIVMNILRIALLFVVSEYIPQAMYFTHKYLFTAFLYGVIFLLWLWWIWKFARKNASAE